MSTLFTLDKTVVRNEMEGFLLGYFFRYTEQLPVTSSQLPVKRALFWELTTGFTARKVKKNVARNEMERGYTYRHFIHKTNRTEPQGKLKIWKN